MALLPIKKEYTAVKQREDEWKPFLSVVAVVFGHPEFRCPCHAAQQADGRNQVSVRKIFCQTSGYVATTDARKRLKRIKCLFHRCPFRNQLQLYIANLLWNAVPWWFLVKVTKIWGTSNVRDFPVQRGWVFWVQLVVTFFSFWCSFIYLFIFHCL